MDRPISTGLSEKKAAKLSEFSLNFPKLADWLCMGWSVCQAAAKAGNSNRGNFFCTSQYMHFRRTVVVGQFVDKLWAVMNPDNVQYLSNSSATRWQMGKL